MSDQPAGGRGIANPDVSVVLPVHNGDRYVHQAIESALSQSGVELELIVVDDGSTDTTAQVVGAFGDRVRFVPLPKQSTNIATTNAGLRLATGDFVSILHHDDYYLPGKLRRHVDLMRAHPEVDLSYSSQFFVDANGRTLARLRSPVRKRDYVVAGDRELRHLVVQNYINFSNAVVRRSAYQRVGEYVAELWVSAEWAMWVDLALGRQVAYIDEPLVCYRLHPEALTSKATTDTVDYHRQLEAVIEHVYGHRDLPADLQRLRRRTEANAAVNTALLQLIRRDRVGALRTTLGAARRLPPWEWVPLAHSARLAARAGSRLRNRNG